MSTPYIANRKGIKSAAKNRYSYIGVFEPIEHNLSLQF